MVRILLQQSCKMSLHSISLLLFFIVQLNDDDDDDMMIVQNKQLNKL